MSEQTDTGATREQIGELLASDLETDWENRADDSKRFEEVLKLLRKSDGTLEEKLRIAGFTDHPVDHGGITQACDNCMYFLVNRRWCDLPELDVPVDSEWSCNVWRV